MWHFYSSIQGSKYNGRLNLSMISDKSILKSYLVEDTAFLSGMDFLCEWEIPNIQILKRSPFFWCTIQVVICSLSTYYSAEWLSKSRGKYWFPYVYNFSFYRKVNMENCNDQTRESPFTYSVKVSAKSVQYFPRILNEHSRFSDEIWNTENRMSLIFTRIDNLKQK